MRIGWGLGEKLSFPASDDATSLKAWFPAYMTISPGSLRSSPAHAAKTLKTSKRRCPTKARRSRLPLERKLELRATARRLESLQLCEYSEVGQVEVVVNCVVITPTRRSPRLPLQNARDLTCTSVSSRRCILTTGHRSLPRGAKSVSNVLTRCCEGYLGFTGNWPSTFHSLRTPTEMTRIMVVPFSREAGDRQNYQGPARRRRSSGLRFL